MVRTPRFHCRGHGFNPWSGNQDPASREVWPKGKKKKSNKLMGYPVYLAVLKVYRLPLLLIKDQVTILCGSVSGLSVLFHGGTRNTSLSDRRQSEKATHSDSNSRTFWKRQSYVGTVKGSLVSRGWGEGWVSGAQGIFRAVKLLCVIL